MALTKRKFKRVFNAMVKWFSFVWERKHTVANAFWAPDVTDEAEKIGRDISRLLLDYTRMDMVDGEADSLKRLQHWLTNEIQQMKASR